MDSNIKTIKNTINNRQIVNTMNLMLNSFINMIINLHNKHGMDSEDVNDLMGFEFPEEIFDFIFKGEYDKFVAEIYNNAPDTTESNKKVYIYVDNSVH